MAVDVEYLYTVDSEPAAARLSCQLSRGTFPHVTWLFNDDPLPPEVHEDGHNRSQPAGSYKYATADQSRTLFLTQLGPKESGYYRCKARDNYDAAGAWVESAAVLVQVTGEGPHHWAANESQLGGTFFSGEFLIFFPMRCSCNLHEIQIMKSFVFIVSHYIHDVLWPQDC